MKVNAVRRLGPADLESVATIHSASWRSAYRGILHDSFLDGDLLRNRKAFWQKRLSPTPPSHFGFLAIVDDMPVGFCFGFGNADPTWGTQLDNLHILPEHKGRGVGRSLLAAFACESAFHHPECGIYLWTYEQNQAARGFYERHGGKAMGQTTTQATGGGYSTELRYTWLSAHALRAAAGFDICQSHQWCHERL